MKKLIGIVAFLFAAVVNAALPLGSASAFTSVGADCSAATTLTTSSCVVTTLTSPNGVYDAVSTAVATKVATLKITNQTGTQTGTIVLFTGGNGASWWENDFNASHTLYLNAAIARGQKIVQVKWTTSWADGSVGARSLAVRGATLLNAIYSDSSIHAASTAFVVVGHSNGASLLGYALATYGLKSIIDLAVFTSGPPHGKIDYLCQGALLPVWAAAGPALCTTGSIIVLGAAQYALMSISYNSRTYCDELATTGGLDNVGERDSIWRSDADLKWPNTAARFIYGDGDTLAVVPVGRWFNRKVTSTTVENITTGSVTHGNVPNSASGGGYIATALAAATYAR